tara:strand:+ start:3545 stop:4543 length:999 start_codon:yes stop_codon:yes gene_type:complete
MPNSTLPIRTGGNPSFPLSPNPYLSRLENNIATNDDVSSKPKNYQSVAFTPGFPLQASELNEIQENFQLQMTLTIAMMNNWITSGAGPMWRIPNDNKPGDGSMLGDAPSTNTGIGVGGLNDPNGGHVEEYAISGPGWRGATPLHPFMNPYAGNGNVHDKQVEVRHIDNDLEITFNPGWWCVELPNKNPVAEDENQYISGLKHWIYIDEPLDVPSIPLPSGENLKDVEIPVGLSMQTEYHHCCDNDDDSSYPCDPELADNSAGFFNSVGCGASRYKINAIGAATVSNANWPTEDGGSFGSSGKDEYDKLSLVCTFNPFRKTVRYMNNIILFTW